MKIWLYLLPPLTYWGGSEKYFMDLAIWLEKLWNDVEIITSKQSFFSWTYSKLLSIVYLRKIKAIERFSEKEINNTLGRVKWKQINLNEINNEFKKYDIVYSRNEIVDLIPLLKFNSNKNNVLIWIHTALKYYHTGNIHEKIHNVVYSKMIYGMLIKKFHFFHVAESHSQNILKKWWKRSFIIPHPIDISNSEKKFNKKNINILFVWRLNNQKWIDILIKIIQKISKNYNNISINIAWSWDIFYEKELIKISKHLWNVNYLWHKNKNEINTLYQNNDIVLIPSRYETVNLVWLEAMSHWCIVLASNIPWPQSYINDWENGFLSEVNFESFYSNLIKILILFEKKLDFIEGISEKSQNYISKFHNKKNNYEKLLTEMRKLKNT